MVILGQFAGHTGWYAFEHLAAATGVNPQTFVAVVSGPFAIPLTVVIVVVFSIGEDKVHETPGAPMSRLRASVIRWTFPRTLGLIGILQAVNAWYSR